MSKLHHPSNKYQRKLLEEKKHSFVEAKRGRIKAERPAKVEHKLTIERLKEIEAFEELRHASYREDNQSSVDRGQGV